MLSRNQYQGRLPYEEYVKRFKQSQDITADLKKNVKEQMNKQIEQGKNTLSKKFNDEMKKRGVDTSKVEQMANILKDKGKLNDKQRNALYTGFILSKAGKPTRTSLTTEETTKAQRIEASKLAYLHDDDFETAQEHLDKISMEGGGVIDKELSTPESLVIQKPNGKVEIAYRGTQLTGKPNLEDIYTDATIAVGADRTTRQFEAAEDQIQKTINKYGRENLDHLTGYSLGGTKALSMGQKFNIESTTYNPFIGERLARGINNTTAKHNILRTTTDFASTGLMVSADRNHANWNVESIRPLAENEHLIPVLETYDGHRLNNFTSNKGRGVNDPAVERLTKALHDSHTILARKGLQHRTATLKNEGKTFSEAYADLQKDSRSADPLKKRGIDNQDIMLGPENKPILKPGGRHTTTSDMVRNWRALGGEFTDHEATVIADKMGIPKSKRSEAQNTLRNRLRQQRQTEIDAIPENLMIKVNGENVSSKKIAQQKLDEEMPIEDQISPQDRLQQAFKEYDDSGIGRKAGNKRDFGKPDLNFTDSDSELEDFINSSDTERQNELNGIQNDIEKHQTDLAEAYEPHEAAGLNEHLRGLSATHLGIGAGIGMLTDQTLDWLDPNDKGQGTLKDWKRDVVSGGISGGLTAATAGSLGLAETALAPEIAAGAAGYVAADYGAKASRALAKDLVGDGVGGKVVQEAAGDVGGGAAGGLGAYLGGAAIAIGSDALLGTELGASLGPAGAAAGAAIGAGIGTLAFGGSALWKGIKSLF
jgi:hypothetical protein